MTTPTAMKPCPKISPWGRVQHQTELIPDSAWSVSTAGHGGIYLTPKLNVLVPDWAKTSPFGNPLQGWYEEDVDWCIPLCFLEAHFRESKSEWVQQATKEGAHMKTLREWHPALFERMENERK